MRLVFADTLYRGAVLHPHDRYRAPVIRALRELGDVRLVTTDEVLAELPDGLAQRGAHLREVAAQAVRTILSDPRVTVHPQSRDSFLAGLRLYEQRNDKGYSLVDCISMTTMRRHAIVEVLTNDHHFRCFFRTAGSVGIAKIPQIPPTHFSVTRIFLGF